MLKLKARCLPKLKVGRADYVVDSACVYQTFDKGYYMQSRANVDLHFVDGA